MPTFGHMTRAELIEEIKRLEKEEHEKQHQDPTQTEVIRQRRYFALSYLVDPKEITLHTSYRVKGSCAPFTVQYLNGVMAWGNWCEDKQLQAIPLGRLEFSKRE
ncbi:YfhH family protein [Mechercharimyces sp. CAU 1602]|uniref:YfhH family protein n=1 Tax=Mechercharimyces sp. CAU 1602 TaxID=2973933 RepID=UPI002161FAA2|nr:YfhH family protein [Mechercharimyces sp. CAU 1602]MCS1352171.1 YfhH family protein [Mechercharimyces sp. CAU 1602]